MTSAQAPMISTTWPAVLWISRSSARIPTVTAVAVPEPVCATRTFLAEQISLELQDHLVPILGAGTFQSHEFLPNAASGGCPKSFANCR